MILDEVIITTVADEVIDEATGTLKQIAPKSEKKRRCDVELKARALVERRKCEKRADEVTINSKPAIKSKKRKLTMMSREGDDELAATALVENRKCENRAKATVVKPKLPRDKCPMCNKEITKKQLKRHIKEIHSEPPRFECNLCTFVTKREDQLNKHKRTHFEPMKKGRPAQ